MTHIARQKPKRGTSAFRLACLIVGVLMLPVAGAAFCFVRQEIELVYWARLARAESDIGAIAKAVESFRKEYGNYPGALQELLGVEIVTRRIPNSPWGGPYLYRIESETSIKIWTIPDRETRDRTRHDELSNKTDWRAIWDR